MQQYIVRKGKSTTLHLFFCGWGMDQKLSAFLPMDNDDLLLVFDYTELSFNNDLLKEYNSFRLTAWSMGVWASEQIELPELIEAVATNGTPHPVHDTWGIPKVVFEGTLNRLSEQSIERFYRRMCGSREKSLLFSAHAPNRSIESLRKELDHIGRQSQEVSPFPKSWDKAIVGSQDLIFPTVNQLNYWEESAQTVERPHFIW